MASVDGKLQRPVKADELVNRFVLPQTVFPHNSEHTVMIYFLN